jgi:hypothetical protein
VSHDSHRNDRVNHHIQRLISWIMVRLRVAVGPLNGVFAVWSGYIGRWESSYAYRLGVSR